jgi:hypothetical protein
LKLKDNNRKSETMKLMKFCIEKIFEKKWENQELEGNMKKRKI